MIWIKNEEEWISKLKVGDDVYTIETNKLYPDGKWFWKSKVTIIESNYVETTFERDRNLEWLIDLTKSLAPHHRTYQRNWVKNYFAPDGTINIKEYTIL